MQCRKQALLRSQADAAEAARESKRQEKVSEMLMIFIIVVILERGFCGRAISRVIGSQKDKKTLVIIMNF